MKPVKHKQGCPLGDVWHPMYGKVENCGCLPGNRGKVQNPDVIVRPSGRGSKKPGLDQYEQNDDNR